MIRRRWMVICLFFCFQAARAQIVVHQENFGAGLGAWSAVNVTDATDVWSNVSGFAEINGFGGSNDEDWLISPAINLNTQNNEFFLFDYNDDFDGGLIKVFYSTNYNGGGTVANVSSATWTELSTTFININRTTCFSTLFQRHPAIDISGINGTAVYFAFKYTGTASASKYYKIDNVRILANYYNGITKNIKCCDLKTELHRLIRNQSHSIQYTAATYDVWDAMLHSDVRINDAGTDTITMDVFTDKPFGTGEFEFDPCTGRAGVATCGAEGTCYQREHSFPKSWWGSGTSASDSAYTDMHHLMPADGYLNAAKNNYPPGVVAVPGTVGSNGFRVGTNAAYPCGGTMSYFEPINEYKGDYARMYFYIVTRYQHLMATWEGLNTAGNCALDGDPCIGFEPWLLTVLLTWHANDPVSVKEINRNNAVYAIQGNRNPFIDNPDWVNLIWGDASGVSCSSFTLPVELTNFTASWNNNSIQLQWETASERNNDYFKITKSYDGSEWELLDIMQGNGTLNTASHYELSDPELRLSDNNEFIYYQLHQVDLNGVSKLIGTQAVLIPEQEISVSPNPFSEFIQIKCNHQNLKTIKLFNMLGQEIYQQQLEGETAVINTMNLEKGNYYLIVSDEEQQSVFRIQK